MKKITLCLMILYASLIMQPLQLKASIYVKSLSVSTLKSLDDTSVDALLNRLNQIKEMDKSELKPVEKKQLRKEVGAIKQQLRATGGGIYISAGAVILIVIILIILL
jgi:hypothetical protein